MNFTFICIAFGSFFLRAADRGDVAVFRIFSCRPSARDHDLAANRLSRGYTGLLGRFVR